MTRHQRWLVSRIEYCVQEADRIEADRRAGKFTWPQAHGALRGLITVVGWHVEELQKAHEEEE